MPRNLNGPVWIGMAVALVLWAVGLAAMLGLPWRGGALLALEAAVLWAFLAALGEAGERSAVQLIFVGSLFIYTLQVLAVRELPQWSDAFPDGVRYDANARGLALHWMGRAASVADCDLRGLRAMGVAQWSPGDTTAYADVLGMSRYLYQAYVAGVYALADGSRTTAVMGNLPFMAGAAAGVYLLARGLFKPGRVAALSVALVVADTNFAVWGSVLLRESLLIFLIVLALLGMVRWVRRGGGAWGSACLALGALGLVALIRFNAVAAFGVAVVGVGLAHWRAWTGRKARWTLAAGGVLLVGVAVLPLGGVWQGSLPAKVIEESWKISRGGTTALNAVSGRWSSEDDATVNGPRQQWMKELRERPLWRNVGTAVWRSFMAPYPWSVFRHGFAGRDFYELMIPGSLLWVGLLPLFFFALATLRLRGDAAALLCVVWLLAEWVIYMIGYGEFSMRQRMMAQPLLWILVALGAHEAVERLPARWRQRWGEYRPWLARALGKQS